MKRARTGALTAVVMSGFLLTPAGASGAIVPVSGLAQRFAPATAVVGKRLFVFGGHAARRTSSGRSAPKILRDGALVDPRTGKSVQISDAPFAPPIDYPQAVKVGPNVVVTGTSCKAKFDGEEYFCVPGTPVVGVYRIASDRWKAVKLPKELLAPAARNQHAFLTPLGATSDGRAVLKSVVTNPDHGPDAHYWTYSPKREHWTQLPDPDFRAESVCQMADELVLLRVKYSERGVVRDIDPTPFGSGSGKFYVRPSLVTLELASGTTWKVTPATDAAYDGSPPSITCLDRSVMVVGSVFWYSNLRRYDERTSTWSTPALAPLPAGGPAPAGLFSAHRVWTGTELIFLPTETDPGRVGPAYNPSTDTWREVDGVPTNSIATALWNGSAIVGYAPPIGGFGPNPATKAGVFRSVP